MVLNATIFPPPDEFSRRHVYDPGFRKFIILSVSVHLLLLAIAGSAVLFHAPVRSYAPSYTVDLVALPPSSPGKTGKSSGPAAKVVRAEKPAARKTTVPPVTRPDKTVEKKQPKVLRPPKSAPGEEAARIKRRKNLESLEEEATRLYESFSAGETTVSSPPSSAMDRVPPASGGGKGVSGGPPVSGKGGGASDIRFKAYYDRIWAMIRAGWVLPQGVGAKDKDLLTVVGIRISATGVIESMRVEQTSGNIYYDQSALRAISKASPLPPLPEELGKESLDVGINFRPQE